MFESVDCGQKVCNLVRKFVPRCDVFIGDLPDCEPPCHLEGCKVETQFNVVCSFWQCQDVSTTTAPTTSTTMPPTDGRYVKLPMSILNKIDTLTAIKTLKIIRIIKSDHITGRLDNY